MVNYPCARVDEDRVGHATIGPDEQELTVHYRFRQWPEGEGDGWRPCSEVTPTEYELDGEEATRSGLIIKFGKDAVDEAERRATDG